MNGFLPQYREKLNSLEIKWRQLRMKFDETLYGHTRPLLLPGDGISSIRPPTLRDDQLSAENSQEGGPSSGSMSNDMAMTGDSSTFDSVHGASDDMAIQRSSPLSAPLQPNIGDDEDGDGAQELHETLEYQCDTANRICSNMQRKCAGVVKLLSGVRGGVLGLLSRLQNLKTGSLGIHNASDVQTEQSVPHKVPALLGSVEKHLQFLLQRLEKGRKGDAMNDVMLGKEEAPYAALDSTALSVHQPSSIQPLLEPSVPASTSERTILRARDTRDTVASLSVEHKSSSSLYQTLSVRANSKQLSPGDSNIDDPWLINRNVRVAFDS